MPNTYHVGQRISLAGREGNVIQINPTSNTCNVRWSDDVMSVIDLSKFPDVKILPDPVTFTEAQCQAVYSKATEEEWSANARPMRDFILNFMRANMEK